MTRWGLRRNLLQVMSNGTEPAEEAVRFLRDHPRLAVFPLGSLVGSILVAGAFFLTYRPIGEPIWYWFIAHGIGPWAAVGPTAYVLVGLFIAALGVVVFSANAALVRATNQAIAGEKPTVRAGLTAALFAFPQIVTYAVVTGSAGVVVAALERRTDWVDGLVATVLGMSYGMFTFFVLPAAVIDGASPLSMFRRSAGTIRSHLGGLATVYLGITVFVTNLFAIPLYVAIILVTINGVLGIVDYATLVHWIGTLLGVPDQRARYLGMGALSVLVVLPLWAGIVLGTSLASIAKTSLYVAIHEDRQSIPLFDIDRDDALVVPEYSS